MNNLEIKELDQKAIADAKELQKRLTKPPGSLGLLEDLSVKLCGISRSCPPDEIKKATVLVFAGDHGVIQEGVTPWPQEVTYQMVLNFLNGGAGINAIAKTVGAEVIVIDVGVNKDLSCVDGLVNKKVCFGTSNIAVTDAMTLEQARACLLAGYEVVKDVASQGCDLFALGDMGIGNTTASAAIISYITGASPNSCTGRGTGINDEMYKHKVEIVNKILKRIKPNLSCVEIISSIGGCEIGAIAGAILGCAYLGKPVIIDGVISLAGALLAYKFEPKSVNYMIAGHLSREPGAKIAIEYLNLYPLVRLDMALGEGTGATLAIPIVKAAANTLREMATFDSAGVSEKP
jgi:nicotinate-nucleotide--dimethylbenzimidazole phosphoribosyltransferase